MHHRFHGWLPTQVALLALGLFGVGCGQQQTAAPGPSSGELPDSEVSDFAITETEEGSVLWKLYARYAATYSAKNIALARSVRVDFFDEQGERSSVLTAREGEINQRTRNMTARGNVVLQTTEGTRLSCEVLEFLNQEQRVLVPDDELVRVERQGDVLTGYGFESDRDLRHYEFKRRVQATVKTQAREDGGARGSTP